MYKGYESDRKNCPDSARMLRLPISVKSYILLQDYVTHYGDPAVFRKMILEYGKIMPLFELQHILSYAGMLLSPEEYQGLVEMLFW